MVSILTSQFKKTSTNKYANCCEPVHAERPVELSETVMPRQRPKKLTHFQPMVNIFSSQEVSKYLAKTPWCI